ncbi:type II secretion system protein [Candidatus Gottesmanbacteria bacterium]|nr:type II secretion system protein [Candidatus Gottesmanbacteria bacterium]
MQNSKLLFKIKKLFNSELLTTGDPSRSFRVNALAPSSRGGRTRKLRYWNGFTLIEVLVAATIVALLSTIGLSGYQAITRSGRDALRKSDLEQIRSALEIYKADNGNYPITSNCAASLSSSYINPYPGDPKSPYKYCYNRPTTLTYYICAHLENGGGSDPYISECGGANQCGGNCNYKVANP